MRRAPVAETAGEDATPLAARAEGSRRSSGRARRRLGHRKPAAAALDDRRDPGEDERAIVDDPDGLRRVGPRLDIREHRRPDVGDTDTATHIRRQRAAPRSPPTVAGDNPCAGTQPFRLSCTVPATNPLKSYDGTAATAFNAAHADNPATNGLERPLGGLAGWRDDRHAGGPDPVRPGRRGAGGRVVRGRGVGRGPFGGDGGRVLAGRPERLKLEVDRESPSVRR